MCTMYAYCLCTNMVKLGVFELFGYIVYHIILNSTIVLKRTTNDITYFPVFYF